MLYDSTDKPIAKHVGSSAKLLGAASGSQSARTNTISQSQGVVLLWDPPTPRVHASRLHRTEAIGATLAPRHASASSAERIVAIARRLKDEGSWESWAPLRQGLWLAT